MTKIVVSLYAGCGCAATGSGQCVILDPFFGSGTTGQAALKLGRSCIGIELNPAYIALSEDRTLQPSLGLDSL